MAEKKNPFNGFIGGSNPMRVQRYDCERTVNMYLEMSSVKSTKQEQPAVLIGTPGLTLIANMGPGPIRAVYNPSNSNNLYVVSGNLVFLLTTLTSTPIQIGTMLTSTGFVSVSDNGTTVVFVDGQYGYYSTMSGTTLVKITDVHFYPASQVTYQDAYFVFAQTNTNMFFVSNPGAITFPSGGLNQSVKSGNPDLLVGLISNNRELYIFGQWTTEIWWDQGLSAVAPFSRQDGKFSQVGCLAQATIARLFNTIMWLGDSPEGGAVIYQMQNDQAVRVSTHAVEYALQSLGNNLKYATAYTWQTEGHFFYAFNCVGLNSTWVYDLATGQWFEQTSTINGVTGRHLAQCHAYYYGTHIVGDYTNGNIYMYDDESYTDNGYPIIRIRQSPHIAEDLSRIFYKLFELDFTTGVGLSAGTNNAVNPTVYLEISNDGGETFGPPIQASLGKIGQYKQRARWQRLGQSRDRVFRVSCSDPIEFNLLYAALDLEIGTN